jgi:hypothetical protein
VKAVSELSSLVPRRRVGLCRQPSQCEPRDVVVGRFRLLGTELDGAVAGRPIQPLWGIEEAGASGKSPKAGLSTPGGHCYGQSPVRTRTAVVVGAEWLQGAAQSPTPSHTGLHHGKARVVHDPAERVFMIGAAQRLCA